MHVALWKMDLAYPGNLSLSAPAPPLPFPCCFWRFWAFSPPMPMIFIQALPPPPMPPYILTVFWKTTNLQLFLAQKRGNKTRTTRTHNARHQHWQYQPILRSLFNACSSHTFGRHFGLADFFLKGMQHITAPLLSAFMSSRFLRWYLEAFHDFFLKYNTLWTVHYQHCKCWLLIKWHANSSPHSKTRTSTSGTLLLLLDCWHAMKSYLCLFDDKRLSFFQVGMSLA